MKKECIAMLLAGGQGSRLYVLTGDMAKPAVPFGGKYRIIDFPLSNCTNSGIDTVGVLTQYRPLELNSYIGSGVPWDLDGSTGGVHILPPYMGSKGGTWYKGTANAIYQNIGFIDLYDPEYVVVLSGDHIYKMDYSDMVERHKAAGAACTISVMEVPWADAPRFGIMNVDGEDMITEFEEKPKEPKSNLASMGIYVFTWQTLRQYLEADEADPSSENDFGKNVIPAMLGDGERMAAYRFSGYWKDVGTLESLWDANMDMLSPESGLDLLDESWPIYARSVKHGYALSRVRPGSAGRVLAHLRPVRQRAAGLPGQAQPDEPQRLQPRQHHRGGGGELRSLPQCHRGRGRAGGLFRALPRRDGGARRRGGVCHPGRGLPHRQKLPGGRHAGDDGPGPLGAGGAGTRLHAGGRAAGPARRDAGQKR